MCIACVGVPTGRQYMCICAYVHMCICACECAYVHMCICAYVHVHCVTGYAHRSTMRPSKTSSTSDHSRRPPSTPTQPTRRTATTPTTSGTTFALSTNCERRRASHTNASAMHMHPPIILPSASSHHPPICNAYASSHLHPPICILPSSSHMHPPICMYACMRDHMIDYAP